MKRMLILDDEPSIVQVIRLAMQKEGWEVDTYEDPIKALEVLKESFFDILLTDLSMPAMSGLDVLSQAHKISPQTGLIIMTAYGTMNVAIEAMREGAQDFITKPFEISRLVSATKHVLEKLTLRSQNKVLKSIITQSNQTQEILGSSLPIQDLLKMLEKVSPTDANVLITGETGVGKELVARKIHSSSARAAEAFIPVNCSAIPGQLLESELFGYRKGAFTGAVEDRVGFFQACDGGTIFLDEIGEMPFALQAKLLRVLAEGRFMPLGSTQEKSVDVRILAATHQDLGEMIAQGTFREDLFYRLNVISIDVPPLRSRLEDIPLLADFFLKQLSKDYDKAFEGFSHEAISRLQAYEYPGNIRQLKHIIEQAIIFEDTSKITAEHIKLGPELKQASTRNHQSKDLELDLSEIEREMISHALKTHNQNKTQAAKALGITFRSLRYRMEKLKMLL